MLAALFRILFVPKATRRRLEAKTRRPGAGRARPVRSSRDTRSCGPARERLLDDAMAIYRRQREVYESLDEETRRQIEADAERVFGRMFEARSGPKG